MFACSFKNILGGVCELAMEKFIVNGNHIDSRTSDIMNWWCPCPVHGTVSMCMKRNDIAFGAIVSDVNMYILQHSVHKDSCSSVTYLAIQAERYRWACTVDSR